MSHAHVTTLLAVVLVATAVRLAVPLLPVRPGGSDRRMRPPHDGP